MLPQVNLGAGLKDAKASDELWIVYVGACLNAVVSSRSGKGAAIAVGARVYAGPPSCCALLLYSYLAAGILPHQAFCRAAVDRDVGAMDKATSV
jgi:hypothetical protein